MSSQWTETIRSADRIGDDARSTHVEHIVAEHIHQVNDRPGMKSIVHDAKVASDAEHQMSLWEGLKTYPKAIGWSVALSTCIVMAGYDTLMPGAFYAMPTFNEKYGKPDGEGSYSLSAAWQIGLNDGGSIGSIFALLITPSLAERFGNKRMLGLALIMITCFLFITFFAPNLIVLEIGVFFCNIPWGMFQTITITYAADVCPVHLRCYLTNYINLCWIIGQVINAGVLRGTLSLNNEWSYKIPYAIQWFWPIPIFVAVCLAPESPWWLVRKGRLEEAERALNALAYSGEFFNAKDTLAMMIHTNEVEKQIVEGNSYWDCFKGVNLRRTEIVCLTWLCQALCGEQLMGQATYFYEQAGLATGDSFSMGLGEYGLGATGAILSWVLMTRYGRRTIYVSALFILSVLLLTIGILGTIGTSMSLSWAVGSIMLIWTFIYDSSVGSVVYSITAEIPSSRLRQKSVGLGITLTYVIATAYSNVIMLYMLNPTAWNWGAKAGFFWGAHCVVCFIWAYFRLPEPKGRSYAELDLLFDQRVSARKFASTVVDPYKTSEETVGGPQSATKTE